MKEYRIYKHHSHTQDGLTLVEVVLYLGISAFVIVILGSVGIALIESRERVSAVEEVSYGAEFLHEQMIRIITEATGVNSPASGATSSSLSLEMANPTLDPTVFSLSDGVVTMKQGAGTTTDLTPKGVTVTDMTFSNVSYMAASPTIRIKTTIESSGTQSTPGYGFNEDFYSTIRIRN